MVCQSGTYTQSDGFLPVYYLGESIKSSICGIDNQFKNIVGGRKRKTKRRKNKKKKRTLNKMKSRYVMVI